MREDDPLNDDRGLLPGDGFKEHGAELVEYRQQKPQMLPVMGLQLDEVRRAVEGNAEQNQMLPGDGRTRPATEASAHTLNETGDCSPGDGARLFGGRRPSAAQRRPGIAPR